MTGSGSRVADSAVQPRLKRALRFRDLTLLYIASALSVRWVATAAAAGPGTLLMWITALAGFYIPMAACVMELSSRYPQEGGLYIWTREAFGDFSGFLAAWMYWMSNLPYFPSILYFGAASILFAAGARGHALAASPAYFMSFAIAWLLVITLVNIIGLDAGKWLNNICSIAGWLSIVLLVIPGFVCAARFGPATHFSASAMVPHPSLRTAIFLSTIFFAFSGAETGSLMGDEIENPRRTIPRALLASGLALAFSYIAGTAALLVALPAAQVSGVDGFMRGAQSLTALLGLPWLLVILMAVLLTMNAIGGAASYLSSTSRLPFVAGIDRYLPPVFGRIHPRFRTPWVAIGVYGFAGIVVAFLGQAGTTVRGAYDVLVSMTIVTTFLPFLFVFAALIRVQSRPTGPEVRRIPGGRAVAVTLALIGFCSTGFTVILSVIPPDEEPNKPLAIVKVLASTAILILGGVILFAIARFKQRTISRAAALPPSRVS
jgi:glutamate:GABA antiporter